MTSNSKKRIRRTIIFLFTVILVLFVAGTAGWRSLKKGIELDSLKFKSTKIENIFLQYKQGLIFHADTVFINYSISPGKDASPFENWIPKVKKWLYLVREVEIKKILYRSHSLSFSYQEGNFTLRGTDFSLDAKADYALGAFYLDIDKLAIKPYQINFSGKASYIRRDERFLFDGHFETSWGKGEMRLTEKQGKVEAKIKSDEFTDLRKLLEQFPIDQEAIDWVSENISAGSYRIDQLLVHFSINELQNFGPENISGTATAQSVDIVFDPALPAVQCDKINVLFQDDRLSFQLENPTYEGKSLTGSNVYIDNVIEPDSVLAINIKATSMLDETVLTLLDTFEINLPFHQITGETDAEINLFYDLPEFDIKTTGLFTTGTGNWEWSGVPLQIQSGEVQMVDEKITINDIKASYEDIVKGSCSGSVDVSNGLAKLTSNIENMKLYGRDTDILKASDLQIPIEVDFGGNSFQINLTTLNTSVGIHEDHTTIDIAKISTIKNIVPFLQHLDFTEGNIHLSFKDLSLIRFNGDFNKPDSILFLNNERITQFTFRGSWTPEATILSLNDDKIQLTATDKMKVILHDYLPTVSLDNFTVEKNDPSFPIPIIITGPKLLLRVKGLEVPTKKFECRLTGSKTMFTAVLEKGRFLFESTGETIRLIGNGLDANFAEQFIRFTDLSEGLVNINLEGDSESYMGYIEFSNVVVRDYLLMNNILAFLNSIPALATFSEPGFDYDGYRVKDGIVHFVLQDKLLTIRQLRTDGTTVNCEATGWIDLNDRSLKLQMELITLKDYSKIIDLLPWAGYAILGEDGSLSTSLLLQGSLDEPAITTSIARDIIMTPVNIIWRTIEWPFKIFDRKKKENTKPPEWYIPDPMVPE